MIEHILKPKFQSARLAYILGETEFDYSNPNICHGSKGGGSTNTVTSSAPPQDVQQAYNTATQAAQTAASQPLQQYGGPFIAGFTPDQLQAFQTTAGTAGAYNPYLTTANQDIQAGTTPLWNSVQQFSPNAISQYESPYTSQVVQATENQLNNQNAQQQQQLTGNAISSGAWGGDRSAVAQAQLAGQQQLAEAPTIAGLENTGYNTALGEFNTQQQAQLGAQEANAYLNEQAGFGQGTLGTLATSLPLEQANAQSTAGSEEQALGQEELNVPYEQFLQQQAYPFQTAQYFANIAEGLGPGQGQTGNATTTQQGASTASQIAGGLLGAAGLLGATGAFGSAGWLTPLLALKSGGRLKRDDGGLIPQWNTSPVPQTTSPGTKPLPLPEAPKIQNNDNTMQDLMGMSALGKLGQSLNQTPQGGLSGAAQSVWNTGENEGQSFGDIANAAEQVGNQANFLGASIPATEGIQFAKGGRAHYDDGGGISPITGAQPLPFDSSQIQQNQYSQISQLPMDKLQQLQTRLPPNTPQGQLVQKAIRQKQFMPNAGQTGGAPAIPQGGTQFQPPGNVPQYGGYAAGGRPRYDDGGELPPPPTPDEIELQQEAAAEPQAGLANAAPQDDATPRGTSINSMPYGENATIPQAPQVKISPWEALAAAGFGMMAGRSPQAGVNIGQGALIGLQNLEGQKKEVGEENYRQSQVEQEAARLAQQAKQFQQQETTMTPYQQAEIGLHQQQLDMGKYDIKSDAMGNMYKVNTRTGDVTPIQGAGFGGFGRGAPAPTGSIPTVGTPTTDAAGLPTGDAALASLPPQIASQVKALAEGRMAFPTGFALKSPYWQNMLSAVSQYDPSFDAVNYNARSKTRNDFTSGKDAQSINALNTALGHLGELQNAGEALPQHDLTALNWIANKYNTATGSSAPVAFQNVVDRVAPELVKAYRGTGGNESDIQAALKDFGLNQSPDQRKAALTETAKLLQSKIDALADQYRRGMGTSGQDQKFYTPHALAVLKNLEGNEAPSQIPQAAIDHLKSNPALAPAFEQKYGVSAAQYLGTQ